MITKARLAEITQAEQRQSDQIMTIGRPRSLTQPVEAQATSFFLSKYILGTKFEYLPSLYSPYSNQEDPLSASIEAVGLASLSNELKSIEVMQEARKRYVYAIKATNTVLRSPSSAKKDSTLLTALVLSLYEAITCKSVHSLCSWEHHMKDAMTLIRLCGREQMDTQLGRQLLSQAAASVALIAHRTMVEVPTDIMSLFNHGLQYASKDDPSWSYRILSIHFANFRAAVLAGSLSDPEAIIAAAKQLDHDFVAWSRNLPPSWHFQTVFDEKADPSLVYEGYYHLYPTHGLAQSMNAWRISRLQLNQAIEKQVLRQQSFPIHPQAYAAVMYRVELNITSLSSEICATIPQYVELPSRLSRSASRTQPLLSTTDDAPIRTTESPGPGFTHLVVATELFGPS